MTPRIVLCLLLAFVCAVNAQQTETKLIIDDFSVLTGPLVIIVNENDLPESISTSTLTNGALGGERDLSLTVLAGEDNLITNSGVNGNNWNVANSDGITGNSFLQYDGIDDSPNLVEDGLGGVDFTSDDGDTFRLLIQSDLSTFYIITVHDMQGRTSEIEISIPGTDTTEEYFAPFDDFVGNADFSNIGALQILVETFEDVDPILEVFSIIGPVSQDPSPSPTRTPTPDPSFVPGSNSPSRTSTPGPSSDPSPSPSPSLVNGGFTWYTFDDDENGREDCSPEEPRRSYFVSDDHIVYYYFFGVNNGNDFSSSSSSASVLAASVAFIAAVVAFVI